jgi:enamine deaminase RidA (YjgF/YER057c/UK114 family)
MKIRTIGLALAALLCLPGCVPKPPPGAIPAPQAFPYRVAAEASPIASSVRVPPDSVLVYVSGTVPDAVRADAAQGSVERYGDTYTQTRSVLSKVERELAGHGLGLSDVVMMRVFLVAPPGEKRMDFAGMMRAYRERFGTAQQPNKPARSTMQVAGLVDPGWLVEIEVTAARPARAIVEIVPAGAASAN